MKEKNKMIISIFAVFLIIALVVGGTYAYWSWVSNTSEQTSINFSVNPSMSCNLQGNGTTEVTSLVPTTCTNGIVKTIVITSANDTNIAAECTPTLNVTAFTPGVSQPSSTQLGNLKWAITTSNSSCTTNVVKSGTFSSLSTGTTPQTLTSLSISVPANTTSTQTNTYYLYVWLDSAYEYTNIGDTNSDPMQNLNFTLQWSGSMSQIG